MLNEWAVKVLSDQLIKLKKNKESGELDLASSSCFAMSSWTVLVKDAVWFTCVIWHLGGYTRQHCPPALKYKIIVGFTHFARISQCICPLSVSPLPKYSCSFHFLPLKLFHAFPFTSPVARDLDILRQCKQRLNQWRKKNVDFSVPGLSLPRGANKGNRSIMPGLASQNERDWNNRSEVATCDWKAVSLSGVVGGVTTRELGGERGQAEVEREYYQKN